MPIEPTDIERIVTNVVGREITGGGMDTKYDGFHLMLDDGRILLFTGSFLIAVYQPSERTLQ